MDLSSAAEMVVSEMALSDNAVPSDALAILNSQPNIGTLPSREEAVDMIAAARWWSPHITCKPEPLSALLMNNATQESGWLRSLLFPTSADSSEIDSNKNSSSLTFSYILTFAESKGLADDVAVAWGVTPEVASQIRMDTVKSFIGFHPVNVVVLTLATKGRNEMIQLLSSYPHGCLRSGWAFRPQDRLTMVFLDAALHAQGCTHIRYIRSLFKCSASSINCSQKSCVRSLFAGFVPEPALPMNWFQSVHKRTGKMIYFNSTTRTVQLARPGLPAPTPTNEENVISAPTTKEPSPTSITEVSKEPAKVTGTSKTPTKKRTPFGNMSNTAAAVHSNGKPAGILKNPLGTMPMKPASSIFGSPDPKASGTSIAQQ